MVDCDSSGYGHVLFHWTDIPPTKMSHVWQFVDLDRHLTDPWATFSRLQRSQIRPVYKSLARYFEKKVCRQIMNFLFNFLFTKDYITRRTAIANKTCVSGKKIEGWRLCIRSILPVRQINIWQAPTRDNFVSTRKTGNYYHKRRLFTNTPA